MCMKQEFYNSVMLYFETIVFSLLIHLCLPQQKVSYIFPQQLKIAMQTYLYNRRT